MSDRAELKVVLYAGETLVGQSTDVALWQEVLAKITGISPMTAPAASQPLPSINDAGQRNVQATPLTKFAADLGVSPEEVEGGLGPSAEPPFISLNARYWEALKRNTPPRGPGAIPGTSLAATALLLWNDHAKFGDVTMASVRATMSTIHLEDANAPRSIANTDWLQIRGGKIVLDPARHAKAVALLAAYCRKEAPHSAG